MKHKRGSNATLDKLVRCLDDAVCAADGLESVGEEIEMAGVTLGTLVDNLDGISCCIQQYLSDETYHGLDSSMRASDLNAGTTLGAAIPHLARESSSHDTSGESVSRKHAVSASEVTAIEG